MSLLPTGKGSSSEEELRSLPRRSLDEIGELASTLRQCQGFRVRDTFILNCCESDGDESRFDERDLDGHIHGGEKRRMKS